LEPLCDNHLRLSVINKTLSFFYVQTWRRIPCVFV
jgi:hypothetical protein